MIRILVKGDTEPFSMGDDVFLVADSKADADKANHELAALRQQVERLKRERDELQAIFDLQREADCRAVKRWQEAHPGKENVWPDRADMVVWLMDQLVEREAAIAGMAAVCHASISHTPEYYDEIGLHDVAEAVRALHELAALQQGPLMHSINRLAREALNDQ